MKKKAVSNLGHEELAEVKRIVMTRADTRAQARALFPSVADDASKRDSKLMKTLFYQAPAAIQMSPQLDQLPKMASAPYDDKYHGNEGPASLAPTLKDTPVTTREPPGQKEISKYNDKNAKKLKTVKTAAVDAFIAKVASMTEAQRRFPELLKVARPTPTIKKRTPETSTGPTGTPPVNSSLSGGSA